LTAFIDTSEALIAAAISAAFAVVLIVAAFVKSVLQVRSAFGAEKSQNSDLPGRGRKRDGARLIIGGFVGGLAKINARKSQEMPRTCEADAAAFRRAR
jgi:hypothetical protein